MKFRQGEIICRADKGYPQGALVCDGYDSAGQLQAHPVGGGFQLRVPVVDLRRFRAVADAEIGSALFHRGRFSLAGSEVAFEGWSNGLLWNGWEMPRFEFRVCEEILRWLSDKRARFETDGDAFVTASNGAEEMWAGEEVTISDGSRVKCYAVGAGSWIWEAL